MKSRKQQLQVSIPTPCQAGWQVMHMVGEQRFCDHCANFITDFTRMSDDEVGRILSQPDAPTCGRFRRSQLDRPITFELQSPRRAWPRLAVGALLVALAMPHALLAASPTQMPVTLSPAKSTGATQSPATGGSGDDSTYVVRGHLVFVDSGDPLEFAVVANVGLGLGASADENGNFELHIPRRVLQDTMDLEVRWNSEIWETRVSIDRDSASTNVTLGLEYHEVFLEGIIIDQPRALQIDRDVPDRRTRRKSK